MTAVSIPTWRPTPAEPNDWFGPDELERSRRYQRPLTRVRVVRGAITLATTLVLIVGEVGPRLLDGLGAEGWVLQLLVMIVLLELVGLLYNPALDWWVDLVHDKKWGLSTQTPRGFVSDQVKSLVLSLVLSAVLLTPLYALIRSTELWWLWGWLLFVAFTIAAGFLFPVLIAPIFNKFEPLDDPELAAQIQDIGTRAGVTLSGAFVADESRRSTRDNAYVSGLGATRRVVLYDTILEHPRNVVCQVVAHEVGHWRRHHLRRQLPILAGVALVAFLVLRALAEWTWLFEQVDVAGIGDPAGLPILLLALQLAFGVLSGVMAWVSRAFERQADLEALDLLGQPDEMIAMLRALHVKNIADLDPGWLKRLQATHPPPAERMAFTRQWAQAHTTAR